jgi:hypothetical protein
MDIHGQPASGIFVNKGLRISVPDEGLKLWIDDAGKLTGDLQLHLHFDVTPTWLDLAWRFLQEAKHARDRAVARRAEGDEPGFAEALEAEMRSSMLAILAGATALDAFYATIQRHIVWPKRSAKAGTKKRPTRWSMMAEAFRRAFRVGNKSFAMLRAFLKEISTYRDRAVHPEGDAAAPAAHPTFMLLMERRFVQFRVENAQAIVGMAHSMIAQLARRPKSTNKTLERYCADIELQVRPLVDRFENAYGVLYKREAK